VISGDQSTASLTFRRLLILGIQNKNRLNNDYCQLWEASEDWGGFQTARIIAQPFLHTKKFLSLPEKILRLAPKIFRS
ncbi:MAG: hypothetical protein ACRD9Y_14540, partial [Blastocatellia bacterium]